MRAFRLAAYILNVVVLSLLVAVPAASAQSGGEAYESPETKRAKKAAAYKAAQRALAGEIGTILPDGTAVAPPSAPPQVHAAVQAANQIVGKPYKYGGGHASVRDRGYDCSGTVSFALIGAGLLKAPLDSSGFMRWARPGKGKWISVYTNPGHAYVMIAGLRLDTGMRDPNGARYGSRPGRGPRWNKTGRSPAGYTVRHPARL